MKILKYLIEAWRTRNWFSIQINPKQLFPNEWYQVSCNVKVNKKGDNYYDNLTLISTNVKNIKIQKPLDR